MLPCTSNRPWPISKHVAIYLSDHIRIMLSICKITYLQNIIWVPLIAWNFNVFHNFKQFMLDQNLPFQWLDIEVSHIMKHQWLGLSLISNANFLLVSLKKMSAVTSWFNSDCYVISPNQMDIFNLLDQFQGVLLTLLLLKCVPKFRLQSVVTT